MFELQRQLLPNHKLEIDGTEYDDVVKMVGYVHEACCLLQEFTEEDYNANRLIQLAVSKLFDVAGSLSFRLSLKTKRILSQIPWKQIEGAKIHLARSHTDYVRYSTWQYLTELIPRFANIEDLLLGVKPTRDNEAAVTIDPDDCESTGEYPVLFLLPDSKCKSILKSGFVNRIAPPEKFSSSVFAGIATSNDPAIRASLTSMQIWFRNLSPKDRAVLHGRIHDTADESHISAFYELFFHEYFVRKNWSVIKDPWLLNFTPDFLVAAENVTILFECFTASSSFKHQDSRESFRKLLRALDSEDSDHLLEVHMDAWCDEIDISATVELVRNWLETIESNSSKSELTIDKFGFCGRVTAVPRGTIAGAKGTVYNWTTPKLDMSRILLKAIRAKSKRYRLVKQHLNMPFVLAVCLPDNLAIDELAICNTLYGSFDLISTNGAQRMRLHREGQSFFRPDAQTRISAIVVCSRSWKNGQIEYDLRVMHNPYAKKLLPPGMFDDHPQLIADEELPQSLQWLNLEKRGFSFG